MQSSNVEGNTPGFEINNIPSGSSHNSPQALSQVANALSASLMAEQRNSLDAGVSSDPHNSLQQQNSPLSNTGTSQRNRFSIQASNINETLTIRSEEEMAIFIAKNLSEIHEKKNILYEHDFKKHHPETWSEKYVGGFASPSFFEKADNMDWVIHEGVSASEAIQSWLNHQTVAECSTTLVAIYLNTIRHIVGNKNFDTLFGSSDKNIQPMSRLRICSDTSMSIPEFFLKVLGFNSAGEPELKAGARYYFKNHDSYLYRHPSGASQGENIIHTGIHPEKGPMWAGFWIKNSSYEEILESLMNQYNQPRTEEDYELIVLNESTRIEPELLTQKREQGFNYQEIYNSFKSSIHPFFISGENKMDSSTFFQGQEGAQLEKDAVMLDFDKTAKIRDILLKN